MGSRLIGFASVGFLFVGATTSLMLASMMAASSACADHMEVGDAPDLLPGQGTTGTAPLNFIAGTLQTAGDTFDLVDLYQITIMDPVNFMAEVLGASFDTQLFLFNLDGTGVASNDDGGTGSLSKLDATGDAALAGLTMGSYLLGISVYDVDPYIGGSEMFPYVCPSRVDTCAPQFGGAFTQWLGTPSGFSSTPAPYMIALNGVKPVPEPTTALLLAAGFVGLALRRRP